MSHVSGVTLIVSCAEDMPGGGVNDGESFCERLNVLAAERSVSRPSFRQLEYGGPRHPQLFAFGAGCNYLDEDAFASAVMAIDWGCPENVVLVIQPEDGPTRVWRPGSTA